MANLTVVFPLYLSVSVCTSALAPCEARLLGVDVYGAPAVVQLIVCTSTAGSEVERDPHTQARLSSLQAHSKTGEFICPVVLCPV